MIRFSHEANSWMILNPFTLKWSKTTVVNARRYFDQGCIINELIVD